MPELLAEHEETTTGDLNILYRAGKLLNPNNPEILSDYPLTRFNTKDVGQVYTLPGTQEEITRKVTKELQRQIEIIHNFFGLKSEDLPKVTLILGASDTSSLGSCSLQIFEQPLIYPTIFVPSHRHELEEDLLPVTLRHEYLHNLDFLLGKVEDEDKGSFSQIAAASLAGAVFKTFPDLQTEYYEDPEDADAFTDILRHLKGDQTWEPASDLIDILGEYRILSGELAIGHPYDSVMEFFVSILNTMSDPSFKEGLQSKTEKEKENIQKLYPAIRRLVEDRISELGLGVENLEVAA